MRYAAKYGNAIKKGIAVTSCIPGKSGGKPYDGEKWIVIEGGRFSPSNGRPKARAQIKIIAEEQSELWGKRPMTGRLFKKCYWIDHMDSL